MSAARTPPEPRVLVVEDDPANLILFERVLRRIGAAEIIGVTDPREALELAGEPDVALVDLHMPHVDGVTLIAELHARWDEQLPILVISGDLSKESRDRALAAGAADFITKPIDPEEVVLRVRNFLQMRALHLQLRDRNDWLEQRVRERTRALREANERLTELDRLKDDFTSMVSHEMRTPITVLRTATDLLATRWQDMTDDQRQRQLAVAQRSVTRLERLVGNLLLTSRVEAAVEHGAKASRMANVRARETMVVASTIGEGDDVVVDCPPDLELRTDAELLVRILSNFVDNARTYGAPPIVLAARRDGNDIVITVRDHGPGVEGDFRSRLFERFEQDSVGDRRSAKGLGLGLWVARGLARMLDGEAWYEPAEPNGAVFGIRLPVAPTEG